MKMFYSILIVTFVRASICRAQIVPMTRSQFRSQFKASDFVFDLGGSESVSSGNGGEARVADQNSMKVLSGEGVASTQFIVEPCGINLPHVHPRATEFLYLIQGDFLRTGFVEENGGRSIVNDIKSGEVAVFPRGLVHYQMNLDCKTAKYISVLNNEDPGVLTISNRLFELPVEALSATFDLPMNEINAIKDRLPSTIAKGRQECLSRCRS